MDIREESQKGGVMCHVLNPLSHRGTVNDLQVPSGPVSSPNEQPSQEPFVRREALGDRWIC